MQQSEVFWSDLRNDLSDPEFAREYIAQSVRIRAIDAIVNELDSARATAGLSKAALARAINAEPANIRRLLSGQRHNPTIGTVAEVAAALGYRLTLEPLSEGERLLTTEPLRHGHVADAEALIRGLGDPRVAV
jgi:DNA-binding phage protein